MGDALPQSPKRRHLLSSINPDEPRRRTRTAEFRRQDQEPGTDEPRDSSARPADQEQHGEPDTSQPRRSRLKLKDHKPRRRRRSRSPRSGDGHCSEDAHKRPSQRPHRRPRHRRHHRSPTPPNPHEAPALNPDAAFRESLFDAMADDEGAAYWEGVYGQPVHVYANERVGPTGELEQMTDEEYAAYVRQKMWEKTNAGLVEERARREEARKRKEKEDDHNRKLQEEMERSLRRGEERRQRRRWRDRLGEYTQAWTVWDGAPASLAWPVESGRAEDVSEQAVRAFFVQGLAADETGEQALATRLKDERVRWHPDKMQQRLGGQVDDEMMRRVTAIFQIVDKLWTDMRPNKA